jgi:hypothetical protein
MKIIDSNDNKHSIYIHKNSLKYSNNLAAMVANNRERVEKKEGKGEGEEKKKEAKKVIGV